MSSHKIYNSTTESDVEQNNIINNNNTTKKIFMNALMLTFGVLALFFFIFYAVGYQQLINNAF